MYQDRPSPVNNQIRGARKSRCPARAKGEPTARIPSGDSRRGTRGIRAPERAPIACRIGDRPPGIGQVPAAVLPRYSVDVCAQVFERAVPSSVTDDDDFEFGSRSRASRIQVTLRAVDPRKFNLSLSLFIQLSIYLSCLCPCARVAAISARRLNALQ